MEYVLQIATTKQFHPSVRNCIHVQGRSFQQANRGTYLSYFFRFCFVLFFEGRKLTLLANIHYTDYLSKNTRRKRI